MPQQRWTLVNQQTISEDPATEGQWSAVIEWPHIPVSAAALPDGRIVTWSSNEKTSFPVQDQMTFSSVYDPQNNSFTDMNNTRHDMFCAGISMLQDGSVLASGGNPNLQHSSIFDIDNNTWTAAPFMNQTRWYGTSLSLSSGEVFATFAKAANEIPEIFTPGAGWTELPDAHMQNLLNDQNQVNAAAVNGATTAQWYAYMHVAPDGRVFHPGPTKTMHWFETDGTGSVTSAGLRNGETRHRQFGSSIMYDVGKLLVSGGADKSQNPASTASALTIDINGATPVVSATASMSASRTNHDAIVLPNGEVLIVGGNSNGILFNDADSIMHAEVWNPTQGQWRTLGRLNIPRNYHSIGILLQDGRVLAAGGGLCGNCTANHQDGQIFSPPYLFNANGSLATRPSITQAPAGTLAAGVFEVQTDSAIQHFSMIRLSGVTHSINTDQRYLPIDFDSLGNDRYRLSMHENPNVLIPGNYWLFALNAQGVPSWGQLINVGIGIANNPPTVTNPGTQSGAVGDSVNLLISSFDPDGDSLSYSAAGLPQGLSINSINGRITGTLQSAITATVTVTVFDGENTREIDFVWQVEDVDNNTAPTLNNPGAQTHRVGDTVDLLLIAADDEGDTLSFSAENLPEGVTLNAQTGRITGSPTQDQQVSTRVSVSDGQASTSQTFSWTISPAQSGGTPLNDGDSDRNTVAFQQWQFYTIEAAANIDRVTIQLGDLTADADLYVRANTPPSGHEDNGGVFDCKSSNSGTTGEICQLENTQATTWHIGVHGYAAADYTVSARLREVGDNTGNDTPITSGQVIEGDLSQGDWHFYTLQSAASDVQINASLTALNADLDLYVRAGERPSGPASEGGSYDCQSILGGTSSERCELQNTGATTWYIGVHAYASGSYTLEATLVDGGSSGDDITSLTLGTEV
ncbi:MAG TPA: hypothetical protein DD979_18320, partial [Gammaproteobacteria bacterium]|nr:hypothetical protein [Gammaproteobacteria bacterium]